MVVYEFVPVLPCGGVDPAFLFMRFHSMAQLDFYLKVIFFRKLLGGVTYFCFIFKRKIK